MGRVGLFSPSSEHGPHELSQTNGIERSLLVLTPHNDWQAWTGVPPPDDEDLEKPYRLLSARGFSYSRLDLTGFPANPAANAHPLFRAIDAYRALRVLMWRRRTDVVVCFFESSAVLILLARRLFGFRGKVVVVDLGMPGWRPRNILLNLVAPRADAILPYSSSHASFITSTWKKAKLVVPVVAQVDTEFYASAPDCPDGPILAVGDDGSRDYKTLLDAAAMVPHRIVIRSKLVAPNGTPPNVEVVGRLALPAYRDLLASASIVVLPMHSVVNGGGTSLLVQAMASGKAVFTSASAGILDYLEDGETALLVPCGDAVAMAAALSRLLYDHDLRRRLGAAARQRALRYNSFEAWADTIESVVNMVRQPSSGRAL